MMKRIDIHYGGRQYSIGGRDFDELRSEVVSGIAAEEPSWLVVNDGEGSPRPAYLLLHHGADIALIPVPDEHP
jgi:hypothetical protein